MTPPDDNDALPIVVSIQTVPNQYRWILQRYRSLRRTPPNAAITASEVLSITTSDLSHVKGVGRLRARRALALLRTLVNLPTAPLASNDNNAIRFPADDHDCGPSVSLPSLDPRYRWILTELMTATPCSPRDHVTESFLKTIRIEHLLGVPGVGPKRAERALAFIRKTLETITTQTEPPPPRDLTLRTLPDTDALPPLFRDAISHIAVPLHALPASLRTALSSTSKPQNDTEITLGRVMALTETFLMENSGYSADEAAALICTKDAFFNSDALQKCLVGTIDHALVPIFALMNLAITDRWAFAQWRTATDIAEEDLLERLIEASQLISHTIDDRLGNYILDLTAAHRVLKGETLEDIGKDFGVTRERIRQRAARIGVTARSVRKRKSLVREKETKHFTPIVENYVLSHPGCYYWEISSHAGCLLDDAEALSAGVHWLVIDAANNEEQADDSLQSDLDTRRRSIAALQIAGTFCFPLSSKGYTSLLRDNFTKGPSAARIIQVFGTWRTACEAAGVESGHTGTQPGHASVFSTDDSLRSVSLFLLDREYQGASYQYDEWRLQQPNSDDLPCFGTIRKKLGQSWVLLRRRVLLHMRSQWPRSIDS
jgi:hypothetical protein